MKTLAKWSIGLVCYPVLSVVALFHGILAGTIFILKHIGWVVLAPFAAATVARKAMNWMDSGDKPVPWIMAGMYLFFGTTISLVHLYGNPSHGPAGKWLWDHVAIVLALGATNLFSLMYEGGRAYWHRNDKPVVTPDEVEEKNKVVRDFMEMWNKIKDMESISKEQLVELTEEIGKLFKEEKIDMNQLRSLMDHLENSFEHSLQPSEDPVSD